MSSVVFVHDLSEEDSWLFIIIVRVSMVMSTSDTRNLNWSPLLGGILNWAVQSVRLIVGSASLIAINGSRTVSLVVSKSSFVWAVNGDLIEVGSESMAMSIRVGEKSALKHLVIGGFNSWHHVGGSESALLNFSEIVVGDLVKDQLANWDERVVGLRNGLGHIIDVVLVALTLFLGNELNIPGPRWEISFGNVIIEILDSIILVCSRDLISLFGSEILDSLVSLEVIFHKENLALLVHPFIGVGTITMHMSETIGSTTV